MTAALRFFVLIEVLGLAATPLVAVALARLPGRGLAFAKPLGLLLVTWVVWVLGSVGVAQSTVMWIVVVALLAGAGALVLWRLRPAIPRGAFLWSEGLALGAFALMALLVAYSPDVWQTEKPMDMAFINAAGNATHFPPEDPWMAGEDLNYYYFGHLMASGLVRLSAVAPDVGYNLAVATFFALSVVAAFGLAYAIGGRVVIGLWGVALCILAGTIGSGLELVDHGGPLRQYDWFGASRVIKGTINEFPAFSFTLADLHGHVMAIPFSLLALAFGLQVAVSGPSPPPARVPAALELACAAIAIGTLYAINAWSFPVIAGLVALCAVVRARDAPSVRERARTLAWMAVLLLLAVLAVLPFLLSYDAAADGLGSVTKRAGFASWAHRPRGDLRAAPLPRLHGLPGGADPLAPPVADGGVDAGGGAVRRLAAGAGRPHRRRPAGGAVLDRGLLRVPPPRAVGRALHVDPDRRRAAVPADPGGRLRARLVRRHRPVPHEHGLQARLQRVAAAGDRGRAGDRVVVGLAAPPRADRPARVGDPAAGPARAGGRLPGGGDLRAQGRLLRRAAPRRAALAVGVRARATRARSSGSATTRRTARSCSRRSATTTPPSATRGSRPSPACRP